MEDVRQDQGSLYGQGSLKTYQEALSHQIVHNSFSLAILHNLQQGHRATFWRGCNTWRLCSWMMLQGIIATWGLHTQAQSYAKYHQRNHQNTTIFTENFKQNVPQNVSWLKNATVKLHLNLTKSLLDMCGDYSTYVQYKHLNEYRRGF